MREEIAKLRTRIEEMQKSRDELVKQNERLIDSNQAKYTEIWNTKYFSLIKIEKLLFVFLSMVYRRSESIWEAIFRYSLKPESCSDKTPITMSIVLNRLKTIGIGFFQQMLDQNTPECPILDVFVKFAHELLSQKEHFPASDDIAERISKFTKLINYDQLVQKITQNLNFEELVDAITHNFNEVENSLASKPTEDSLMRSEFDDYSIDDFKRLFFKSNHED